MKETQTCSCCTSDPTSETNTRDVGSQLMRDHAGRPFDVIDIILPIPVQWGKKAVVPSFNDIGSQL